MKLILTPNHDGSAVAHMTAIVEGTRVSPHRRYLAPGEIEVDAPTTATLDDIREGARALGATFALFSINPGTQGGAR